MQNILGLAVVTILLISGIFVYFYNQNIRQNITNQVKTEAVCMAVG